MNTTSICACLLAFTAAILAPCTNTYAADTRVLPFQGRVTDANGTALPDGTRVVQFKVYDAPVGGRSVWNGEVHHLTINAGLVSTLLGTKASLSGVDFNQDLYLELTIDANADGQITLADPPLLPRQSILPAVFARESANARSLGGYDWSPLFGTNNPADGTLLDSKIGDSSLATSKLRDGAITTSKIANGAVTGSKLDVTGASAGQSLVFNGTNVAWTPIHAVTADNAVNAANAVNAGSLDGYDWSAIFGGGNPQSGALSVASVYSRADVTASGNLYASGRTYLYGPSTTVYGNFFAAYMQSSGDVYAVGDVYARGVKLSSDRNLKENLAQLDTEATLDKVLALPVTQWNYKSDSKEKHIGPMAQDFQAAFQLNADDQHISLGDEIGVALAAIQGLNKKIKETDNELMTLVKGQQEQIRNLQREIESLKGSRR